jgi:RNA polymerase sigma-70 factor (ECF subfamily)
LNTSINIEEFKQLKPDRQLNILVKNYSKDLYWVIRPIVKTHENADDVLQNTFIKIYKALPNFRFESKLFSWMYRIAVNESLIFLQKHNRKYTAQELNAELIEGMQADIYYNGDDIMLLLERAILNLPAKQQEVFRLKYFSKMKYAEMAEILDTSVGSLKASYHLAVKKIKTELNLLEK